MENEKGEISEESSKKTSHNVKSFKDFEISDGTLKALYENGYKTPSLIQCKTIPRGLARKNIIAQAETGSGKTLAFLVPLIEFLVSEHVSWQSGVVAIILLPTRELAAQIYFELMKLSKYHRSFTFLDVMGGGTEKSRKTERLKVTNANVLISTPGRLLEHQNSNAYLDLNNVQLLILDEADRLLEHSFVADVQPLLDNLPAASERITWLFSATQRISLTSLHRLGLARDTTTPPLSAVSIADSLATSTPPPPPSSLVTQPSLIQIGTKRVAKTPKQLKQCFVQLNPAQKPLALFNLLQAHANKKVLVFFNTRKHVLFMHDLFALLLRRQKQDDVVVAGGAGGGGGVHGNRRCLSLMQLRGNMKLDKRLQPQQQFQTARHGVLFTTDVSSRGLDIPNVHWVIQYDAPKDLEDYIHRVGRTARYNSPGNAVLFVMPHETAYLQLLSERGELVHPVKANILTDQQEWNGRVMAAMQSSGSTSIVKAGELAMKAYLRDYAMFPQRIESAATTAPETLPEKIKQIFVSENIDLNELRVSFGLPVSTGTEDLVVSATGKANNDAIAAANQGRTDAPIRVLDLDRVSDAASHGSFGLFKLKRSIAEQPEEAQPNLKTAKLLEVDSSDEEEDDNEEL